MVRVLVAVVVVMSAAFAMAADESPEAAPPAAVEQPFPPGDVALLRMQNDGITVSAVMGIVSSATRWQIVCTEAAGKVRFGLWAQDMLASDLVRAVVKSQGLACNVEGNSIYIMTRDEYSQSFGARKVIVRLKNAPPERVAAALQMLLSSNQGKVAALPESSSLVIYDTPPNLEILTNVAAEIDQPLEDAVIQLTNVTAEEASRTLQPFLSQIGRISPNQSSNQILVSDIEGKIGTIEKMAGKLDLPSQRETRQFCLKYAECTTVASYLADMFGLRKGITEEQVIRVQPAGTPPETGAAQSSAGGYRNIDALAGGSAPPGAPAPAAAPSAALSTRPAGRPQGLAPSVGSLAGQGTVVPDMRVNAVWVTDVPDRLRQIAEVVAGLDAPTETETYKFNYADPSELGIDDRLASVLLSPFDHYETDPATRRVTVTSTASKIEQVITLFREWDVEPAQVCITGKVMSVSKRKVDELGITYDVLVSNMNHAISTAVRATGTFPPAIPAVPRGGLRVGDLATNNFTALLEALETDSNTRLLSSPRVLVRDGSEAVLTVTTDEPYTEVVVSGDTNTTLENVKFKSVGVTLKVTPKISGRDVVSMNVALEVSSLEEFRNSVPVVSSSRMQSSLVVADGQPLVIGGLIDQQSGKSYNGVPVLNRIPLLGLLFRNTHRDRSQRELVLVITPRIVGTSSETEPTLDTIEDGLGRGAEGEAGAAGNEESPRDEVK